MTVECLSCGARYAKPGGRGTVKTNPGCPECNYLGWAPCARRPGQRATDALTRDGLTSVRRLVVDRHLVHLDR